MLIKNQKFQHRSIRKSVVFEDQLPSNIHECMTAVYGDSAPSRSILFEWDCRFNNGQLNIEDRPRSARLISATDEKNVQAGEKLVVEERRITIHEIAEILRISKWHRSWHFSRSFIYD